MTTAPSYTVLKTFTAGPPIARIRGPEGREELYALIVSVQTGRSCAACGPIVGEHTTCPTQIGTRVCGRVLTLRTCPVCEKMIERGDAVYMSTNRPDKNTAPPAIHKGCVALTADAIMDTKG